MAVWTLIAASAGTCMVADVPSRTRWLTGDFAIIPVTQHRQLKALRQLDSRSLMAVPLRFAQTATGDEKLAKRTKYYLVRVGWYAPAPPGTVPNPSVRLTVQVDSNHTAYVTSALLTHSEQTTEFAAILASSVQVRRVVRVCWAAE